MIKPQLWFAISSRGLHTVGCSVEFANPEMAHGFNDRLCELVRAVMELDVPNRAECGDTHSDAAGQVART